MKDKRAIAPEDTIRRAVIASDELLTVLQPVAMRRPSKQAIWNHLRAHFHLPFAPKNTMLQHLLEVCKESLIAHQQRIITGLV